MSSGATDRTRRKSKPLVCLFLASSRFRICAKHNALPPGDMRRSMLSLPAISPKTLLRCALGIPSYWLTLITQECLLPS